MKIRTENCLHLKRIEREAFAFVDVTDLQRAAGRNSTNTPEELTGDYPGAGGVDSLATALGARKWGVPTSCHSTQTSQARFLTAQSSAA